MNSGQPSPGTSGSTPVYLIVSAPAPASITGDNSKDVISVQSLQQPQQSQSQPPQTLPSANISQQTRTSTLSNLDLSSTARNVGAMASSMPQVPHPQVAYLNQSTNIKSSPKVIPGHVSENVAVFPTLLQQVQSLQKGQQPLLPQQPQQQQQLISIANANSTISQPVSSIAQGSGGQITESVQNSSEAVNAQIINLLCALQQRQQEQQQQQQHQPEALSPPQQHTQLPQQHIIFPNSDLKDASQTPTAQHSRLIQSTAQQGLHVNNPQQQLFQSNQDMSQVLQAVLTHTAAMQGNLTTILTTLSNLMRQQQNHAQQEVIKQDPTQSSPVLGHQLPLGIQTLMKSSTPIMSTSSSVPPQSVETAECTNLPQSAFKQTPSVGSCTITSAQSGLFSEGLSANSQSPITNQSAIIQNPVPNDRTKMNQVESTETLPTLARNFDDSNSDQPLSQTHVPLPMDVDALLQQILGDNYCQKPDPTLASVKLDNPVSHTSQSSSQMNQLNQQQFVDSLLNQAQPAQVEIKAAHAVDHQNSSTSTTSSTSTLRSLLTESSWLNAVNKSSENTAPVTSVSSTSSIFGQACSSVGPDAFIQTDSKDKVTDAHQQPIQQKELITNPQEDNQQLQVQEANLKRFDQIDTSSQLSQPSLPQPQMMSINLTSNSQRPDSHISSTLFHDRTDEQPSVPRGIFLDRDNNQMDYDAPIAIPLSKARHEKDDGDSSGGEDSSPSCSPSSSHCGSPIPSRNSPTEFITSDMICQDSDTQMSVIRRYHDLHLGSCSDSAVDETVNIPGSSAATISAPGPPNLNAAPGLTNFPVLNSQFSGARSSIVGVSHQVRSSAQSTVGDESQTGFEDDDDDDEMEPAAKQRRGINQTHVSDFCTTDEESNHGNLATSTWSSPSAPNAASDASSPPPLILNQNPRLSGSGASLIMPTSVSASDPPPNHHRKIPRLPSLSNPFEARQGPYDLKILVQPEEQHRARYMTEGSRGAVKDRSGQGHPVVQLLGWRQAATLQVFVGTDVGRVKPHGFYQACKVSGKNSTPCKERNFDGTNVIEIQFDPQKDMQLSIDCVGILKLRNADVEQRIGLHKTKKSTKARLIFRVNLPRGDGSFITVQTFTDPILCTQPIGSPEISRVSAMEASCYGGLDLFIIGKNFARGTKVVFQEISNDGKEFAVWEMEGEIETEHLGQSHLICKVPPYGNSTILNPVTVQIVIICNGRSSEPHPFTYKPDVMGGDHRTWNNILSVATSLSRTSSQDGRNATQPNTPGVENFVSPVALELNKLVQVKPSPSVTTGSSGEYLSSPVSTTLPFHLSDIKSNSIPSASPVVPKDSSPASTEAVPNSSELGELVNNTGSPSHQRRRPEGPEQMDWTKIELPIDVDQTAKDCFFLTDMSGGGGNRTPGNTSHSGKGSLQAPGSNPDTYYIP